MPFRGRGGFGQRGGQYTHQKIPSLFDNSQNYNKQSRQFNKNNVQSNKELGDEVMNNNLNTKENNVQHEKKFIKPEKNNIQSTDKNSVNSNTNGASNNADQDNLNTPELNKTAEKSNVKERLSIRKDKKPPQGGQQNQQPLQQQQQPPRQNYNQRNFQTQNARMNANARQDLNRSNDKYYGMGGDKIKERAKYLGQLFDLEPLDMSEKKFNVYCKLFVTNFPRDTKEEDLRAIFEKYGEIGSIYIHKEAFAFITFDYKETALKAKKELHGTMIKSRPLQVRIASVNEGVTVKNLANTVTNELLEKGFSIFGPIESCRVNVDDRGKPTGEGFIIFKEKRSATLAVAKCTEECYILTGTSRPVIVTPLEASEVIEEGFPEEKVMRDEVYNRDRSVAPHFATETSFEYELGVEWKKIYQQYEERTKILKAEFDHEIAKMDQKLVLARVEFEKEQLRKELAAREAESAQLRRRFEVDVPNAPMYPEEGDRHYEAYSTRPPVDVGYERKVYETQYSDSYEMPQSTDYDRGYNREYRRPQYNYEDGGYGMQQPAEGVASEEVLDRAFEAPASGDFDGDNQSPGSYQQQFKRLQPPQDFEQFKRARF